MVLLTKKNITEFAPPVGRVVLYCAEFESVLDAFYQSVAEARLKQNEQAKPKRCPTQIEQKIDDLVKQLEEIGADNLSASLAIQKENIVKIMIDRNHVIHGQWFLNFETGAVLTAKLKPGSSDMEYREWDVATLNALVESIRDIEHIVYEMNDVIRGKWLKDPNIYFAVEDEDGVHKALPSE